MEKMTSKNQLDFVVFTRITIRLATLLLLGDASCMMVVVEHIEFFVPSLSKKTLATHQWLVGTGRCQRGEIITSICTFREARQVDLEDFTGIMFAG